MSKEIITGQNPVEDFKELGEHFYNHQVTPLECYFCYSYLRAETSIQWSAYKLRHWRTNRKCRLDTHKAIQWLIHKYLVEYMKSYTQIFPSHISIELSKEIESYLSKEEDA